MKRHTSVSLAGYLCAAIGLTLPALPAQSRAADEVRVYLTVRHANNTTTECGPNFFDAGEAIAIDVSPYEDGCSSPPNPCRCGLVDMVRINAENPTTHTLSDVGPVSLTGTRYDGETLRVLIAGFDDDTGIEYTEFPDLSSAYIPAGARDWAGVVAGNGTQAPAYLRENTILAASITGNLDEVGISSDSKIEVGRVVRLQVRLAEPSSLGGNINLPVEAWASNNDAVGGRAIGYVSASNSISADIRCMFDASVQGTPASITSITVGPNPDADGISGRILAPWGSIGEIRSTGPIEIESSAESPGILAGGREEYPFRDGIDFIMAGKAIDNDADTPNPAFPRDINAVIVCHSSSSQSLLKHIRTAGDLRQPVFADALGWPNSQPSPTETRGIFVGGTVYKPITIKDSVYLASIVAATFGPDANITIGNLLKGRVEAITNAGTPTEPDWQPGDLRHVTIGRSPPANSLYPGNGMNGWAPNDNDPESVVRAREIERFDASRVFLNSKNHAPAILADVIHEIEIGRMQHGIIAGWTLDPSATPPPRADLGDVFIGTITYANGGNGANYDHPTVWADLFKSFVIEQDNAGYLHFSQIPEDRALLIGHGLRGPYDDGSSTAWKEGAIFLDDATAQPGLHGCVVLNRAGAANPDPEEYCSGPVLIERTAGDVSLEADAASQLDLMPKYTRTSDTIGGGAAGLAPFYLYETDCDPPHDEMVDVILTREFDQTGLNPPPPRPVTVRFYGPVRTGLATGSPVELWFVRYYNGMYVESPIDASRYDVTVKRGEESGFSREITLLGNGTWKFPAGWYEVRRADATPPPLFCDLVKLDAQGLPIPVREFVYGFYLTHPDSTDTGGPEDPDCPCPADFDQNGGVDGADVEAFFAAWADGEPTGDTNCDGGVDGGDVEWFFLNWENGGCD